MDGAPATPDIRHWRRALIQVPLHHRLGFKLTVAAIVVTFLPIALLSYLSIRAQTEDLIEVVGSGAEVFSETIRSSTHSMMLDGHQNVATRLMESVAGQKGVEKFRILNKEGQIVISSDPKERGTFVDKKAESCYACHAAGQPLTRLAMDSRTRIYRTNGHRVLAMVTPIYNEPACSNASCHVHPPEKSVLGVVDIGISLAEIDTWIARETRRTLAISALALLALAALVVLAVQRLVFRPVRSMVQATRRIGQGDLTAELPVYSPDELGLLSQSFNEMRVSLAKARSELQALADGLERQVDERTSALRSAQEVLLQSEKLASLGKLSASIAHEINNPLAGILTFARLMIRTLESGPPDEAARAACIRNLGLIRRETERCTTIVRSLLEFARARPLDRKPVDLNAALDEALSLTQHKMQLDGIELKRELAGPVIVEGDFGQLRQAFVNVLLNSTEAMPKGGTITVASRILPDDGCAEVVVTDTGDGIAAENLNRIFDPFFTTKQMGTGLGLSVVYGIIEKHGGSMKARSRVGEGTTMTMRLPLAGPEEGAAASVAPSGSAAASAATSGTATAPAATSGTAAAPAAAKA